MSGNIPGIHAVGLQSHVPGSSRCPGGQPLLGVCSPRAGRREAGRRILAIIVCQDPAGPGRPRLEAEPGWVGGGVRQREERVQRPGKGTARHSARGAVHVCEEVPHTSTLQTLGEPPTPTRPARGTGGAWSHAHRAIRLVGETETNNGESPGGGKPKAGGQGGPPRGGVPRRIANSGGSPGPRGCKE